MDFTDSLSDLPQLFMQHLPKIAMAVLTLVIGLWIVGWITRLLENAMQKRGFDQTIRPFLASLVNVGLKVMLLLSIAGMFGVETIT